MEYKSLELRVGITVFISAVILTVGLMWFQGFKVGRSEYELHAVFPMVGSISRGDKVNVNGVERGEVKRVELRDNDVLVTMGIDVGTNVPEDSRIVLQTVGIMGERVVTILLGSSGRFLEPGAIMAGVYDPGISEALAFLGNIMDELTTLTHDMRRIASTLTQGDKLAGSVDNLVVITREMRALLERDGPELHAGVRSLRRSAETVEGLLERNSGAVDTMFASFGSMSRDLPELARRMRSLTDTLAVVAAKLQRDDNTLGALVNDRAFMDRLDKTVKELGDLVADVKANPKKYLKISIF
jgi:phospholipid/cholesterol/gamma-HCH transport system substrate-binding protein